MNKVETVKWPRPIKWNKNIIDPDYDPQAKISGFAEDFVVYQSKRDPQEVIVTRLAAGPSHTPPAYRFKTYVEALKTIYATIMRDFEIEGIY